MRLLDLVHDGLAGHPQRFPHRAISARRLVHAQRVAVRLAVVLAQVVGPLQHLLPSGLRLMVVAPPSALVEEPIENPVERLDGEILVIFQIDLGAGRFIAGRNAHNFLNSK